MTAGANGSGSISRGNMTVVLSAAGLIMLAFGSFITFQNNATDRRLMELREDVKELSHTALMKQEHEEFKLRIDKDLEMIRRTQELRATQIVPRSEHEARWKANDDFSLLLSNRINQVRGDLAAITTPQSQFIRMEADIAELRRQIHEGIEKKP